MPAEGLCAVDGGLEGLGLKVGWEGWAVKGGVESDNSLCLQVVEALIIGPCLAPGGAQTAVPQPVLESHPLLGCAQSSQVAPGH